MIGVDPASIVPLSPSSATSSSSNDPPDATERLRAVAAAWIDDRFGAQDFRWEDHWHYAPHDVLSRAFSRGELVRLWHGSVLGSKLDDHFQEGEALLWKVQHSLWRYGGSRDFGRFAACHDGLARLSAGLPDFDVRIVHTRSINTAGWAEHGRDREEDLVYLDASFGVLLYHRGRHVMTIGFAFSPRGIFVAQVQLREKRGNRFLYRLPMPHLDFALDLLRRAYPDDDLHLVTGDSTVRAIRAAYGKDGDARLSLEAASRVRRFYDQPLRGCARTREVVSGTSDDGRMFQRLAFRVDRAERGESRAAFCAY